MSDQMVNLRLRILTYNIRHGLGADDVLDLSRTLKVLRASEADIVFLQEVDRCLPRTGQSFQAAWLADELGFHFAYDDNFQIRPFKGMGNAILSRYPIHSTWNKHMPATRERRGLIYAEIKVDDISINFFCTHWGLDSRQRLQQAHFCVEQVNSMSAPTILCGDFNATALSSEVATLVAKTELEDTWPGSPSTYPVGSPTARIDYILTRGNWKAMTSEIIDTIASDHYPVLIDLQLTSPL